MAKTQYIKRRIRSVRNTMQLTRAMKMVAAAKLRRAQDRILNARPYAQRTLKVLRSLAARANPELHPLLQTHGDRRLEMVVVTGDKKATRQVWRDIEESYAAFICDSFLSRIPASFVVVPRCNTLIRSGRRMENGLRFRARGTTTGNCT